MWIVTESYIRLYILITVCVSKWMEWHQWRRPSSTSGAPRMSTLCSACNSEEFTNLKPRKEFSGSYLPPPSRSFKKGVLCDMQIMTPAIDKILLQTLDGTFTFLVPMNIPLYIHFKMG
jgi:hypothetical protein